MKTGITPCKSLLSCILILALMFSTPFGAFAQTAESKSDLLANKTQVILRIDEEFKSKKKTDTGVIRALVESDVYSADESRVLITAGTPAFIEYSLERNGAWGKAGRINLSYVTTKTVDNKNILLSVNSSKRGGSSVGAIVMLSIIFFPIGLVSGAIKGSMPFFTEGELLNASVMIDVTVGQPVIAE